MAVMTTRQELLGRRTSTTWRTAAMAVIGVAVMVGTAPASAQQDPYGSTTTTAAPDRGLVPSCSSDLTVGAPGASGVLTIDDAPFGATVRVLIGGAEAGRATAPDAVPGASEEAAVLAVPFSIPDLAAGRYSVTAVGADFTVTCAPVSTVQVAGVTEERSGGILPRTGVYVALLAVLAIVLLIVGQRLVAAARRRRLPSSAVRRSSTEPAAARAARGPSGPAR